MQQQAPQQQQQQQPFGVRPCRCGTCTQVFNYDPYPTVRCPYCQTTVRPLPPVDYATENEQLKRQIESLKAEIETLKSGAPEKPANNEKSEGKEEIKSSPSSELSSSPTSQSPAVQQNTQIPPAEQKITYSFPTWPSIIPMPQIQTQGVYVQQPNIVPPKPASPPKKLISCSSKKAIQISVLVVILALAIVGLIVGIVQISSGGSTTSTFLTVGIVSILLVIGIFVTCEILWKRGKEYSLLFDFAIGMAFFFIQLGVYMLCARVAFEDGSDSKDIWMFAVNLVTAGLVSIFTRFYLINRISRLRKVAPDLKTGGPISWTISVFSSFIVAWIGFGVWPKYLATNQGWIVYLGVTIIYLIVMFLSYESNRGFLVVLSTIVSGATPYIWYVAVSSTNDNRNVAGGVFLIISLAGSVLIHHPKVRKIWVNIASFCLFLIGFIFQITATSYKTPFDFFSLGTAWRSGLANALWIVLLCFLPGFFRNRAWTLPAFLCAGLALVNPVVGYGLWPVGLIVLILIACFYQPETTLIGSEDEEKTNKIRRQNKIFKSRFALLMRICSFLIWAAYLVNTWIYLIDDDNDKSDRIFFIIILPFILITSIILDFRAFKKLSALKTSKRFVLIQKKTWFSLSMFILFSGFSAFSVTPENQPFMGAIFLCHLIIALLFNISLWRSKNPQRKLKYVTGVHASLFIVVFYMGFVDAIHFNIAKELDVSYVIGIALAWIVTWKKEHFLDVAGFTVKVAQGIKKYWIFFRNPMLEKKKKKKEVEMHARTSYATLSNTASSFPNTNSGVELPITDDLDIQNANAEHPKTPEPSAPPATQTQPIVHQNNEVPQEKPPRENIRSLRIELFLTMASLCVAIVSGWMNHTDGDMNVYKVIWLLPFLVAFIVVIIPEVFIDKKVHSNFFFSVWTFGLLICLPIRVTVIQRASAYPGLLFSILISLVPILYALVAFYRYKKFKESISSLSAVSLELTLIGFMGLSLLDSYYAIATMVNLGFVAFVSIFMAQKLQKAALFNIFFVAVVWTARALVEALLYSSAFLDILGAFLIAYGIALHIPWVDKSLGLRIEYTDLQKNNIENKRYFKAIIDSIPMGLLHLVRLLILIGGMAPRFYLSYNEFDDSGVFLPVLQVFLLILFHFWKDFLYVLVFPILLFASFYPVFNHLYVHEYIYSAILSLCVSFLGCIVVTVPKLHNLPPLKQLLDDRLKFFSFREIIFFWCLVFSLFLNDESNYGIVPLLFFLMTIGRAFLYQNRIHFIIAAVYLVISESICISRDRECHVAFSGDDSYVPYGIGFIILGVFMFVYSLWKPFKKEKSLIQNSESTSNISNYENAEPETKKTFTTELYVLFKILEFIFLNIGVWMVVTATQGIFPAVFWFFYFGINYFFGVVHLIWIYPLWLFVSFASLFEIIGSSYYGWGSRRDHFNLNPWQSINTAATITTLYCMVVCLLSGILHKKTEVLFKRHKLSDNYIINFSNLTFLIGFAFSYITGTTTYGFLCIIVALILCLLAIVKRWAIIYANMPGFLAASVTPLLFLSYAIDVSDYRGVVAGIIMLVSGLLVLITCKTAFQTKFWKKPEKISHSGDVLTFANYEKGIYIILEEICIFWMLLGSILISYTSPYEGEGVIGVQLIFVIVCLLIGATQAIVGFRTKKAWRRLQGLILMTIAVMTAAFVPFGDRSSIIRSALLILGALMLILIIILQMYWWNVFQKLCGTKEIKNDIQDQLEKDNEDTLKQKEILNQPEV